MNAPDLFSGSLIGQVVWWQGIVFVFGIIATIALLIFRNAWVKYTTHKTHFYTEQIITVLFQEDPKARKYPKFFQWNKNIYRDVLLNQIQVLVGHEREFMVQHYLDMGFFKIDSIQMRSRYWWRRLTALIRIDTLSIAQSRPLFVRALKDIHPLVAIAATRALSRLPGNADDVVNPVVLFESLERVGLKRRTALIEIISNIGSHYGPEVICEYLEKCTNQEMAIACVHVLGESRSAQAMPIFIQALTASDNSSEAYLIKVLNAVTLIADPEAIVAVRNLLKHSAAEIRARAIMALSVLGDVDSFEQIQSMKDTDPSREVQRALKNLERKPA